VPKNCLQRLDITAGVVLVFRLPVTYAKLKN
jgi:hypothetical protein